MINKAGREGVKQELVDFRGNIVGYNPELKQVKPDDLDEDGNIKFPPVEPPQGKAWVSESSVDTDGKVIGTYKVAAYAFSVEEGSVVGGAVSTVDIVRVQDVVSISYYFEGNPDTSYVSDPPIIYLFSTTSNTAEFRARHTARQNAVIHVMILYKAEE